MSRRRKVTKKDKELAKEYDVSLSYWRYGGRKGIYWYLVSQYIRKRDLINHGTCISCGRPFSSISEMQAGHYAPADDCGFKLLFDERNINAECPACNNPRYSPGKLIPYRSNLVKRFGEKWVKKLDAEYINKTDRKKIKEWNQDQYHKEIIKLKNKIKKLDEKIS